MKRPWILRTLIQTSVAATLLSLAVARAQQSPNPPPNDSAPVQPLAPLANGGNNSITGAVRDQGQQDAQPEASAQEQPDTHVLSSAETAGLGSLRRLNRIFDPALQFSELGETGVVAGQIVSVSSLGGSLDVAHRWRRYSLTLSYHGGDSIYQPSSYGVSNLPYHEGGISQEISLGRWRLRLRDDAQYSQGSGFGSLFAGGPVQVGQNSYLASIQPSLSSGGTIQTGLARQLSNTAVAEIDYAPTRRTTLTLVGSYGLLHFLDPGYLNSQTITGSAGYNYALSAKNDIAVSYGRNLITFVGSSSRLQSDLVQVAFGRKVTGRLAFQVSAGPQLIHFDYLGAVNKPQLSWSASSSLTYQRRRTGYSLAYFRGVNAGSGVFFGSESQTVTATAKHEFTRIWSASVNGGYAVNKALASVANFASQFDNWFAGVGLNRPLGRQFHMGLSYAFEQQTSGGGAGCPVSSCGLPGSFSQFGITLQWHPLLTRAR